MKQSIAHQSLLLLLRQLLVLDRVEGDGLVLFQVDGELFKVIVLYVLQGGSARVHMHRGPAWAMTHVGRHAGQVQVDVKSGNARRGWKRIEKQCYHRVTEATTLAGKMTSLTPRWIAKRAFT